jgi:DNA-directed RNA polymerase specialized sigma24 family protein
MSRNFTADQILTERLITNDTKAFEELYRRYWYSLYFSGLRKLQSREESKQLVQNVFVDLWQQRHSFTTSFHLAQHLYEEGKNDIFRRLEQRISGLNDSDFVETDILSETNIESTEQIHSVSAESITLQRKLVRYVNNHTVVAESRRTQVWLSETQINTYLTSKEKDQLEEEILEGIQGRTAYLLFYPKKESPWWQKIAAMF